ncbi:MAG: molecular chaperone DnaJ [Acidimicrobiia bacterium]
MPTSGFRIDGKQIMQTDFYELLGVSRNADANEIKKAYRAQARKYHPDANQNDPEAEEQFKAISVAYEVLSDPEKRARYDQFGIDGLRGNGGFNGQAGGGFEFNLSDLFESFFGGSGFSNGFSRNAQTSNDVQAPMQITLHEAAFGTVKTLNVDLERTCATCSGSGAQQGSAPITCSTCGGAGAVQEVRNSFFGQMMVSSICPTCSGYGSIIQNPCNVCNGSGVNVEDVNLEVTIPAGVETGSRLKLPGQGPAGYRNSNPGDLYVLIEVLADKNYERHGDDLVGVKEISFINAIFGTSIEIETLDGPQMLSIPPGTKSGEVFKLKNHGMGKLRGRGRGDLLIFVNVEIPSSKNLNDEQKELLKNYAQLSGEEINENNEHQSLFERVKRHFHD